METLASPFQEGQNFGQSTAISGECTKSSRSSNEDICQAPPILGAFPERSSIRSPVSQVAKTVTSNGSTNSIQFVTVMVPLSRLPECVLQSANPHIALPITLPQPQSPHFTDAASGPTITSIQKDPLPGTSRTTPRQSKAPRQSHFKKIPRNQAVGSSQRQYKRPLCVFCGKVFPRYDTLFEDHLRSHIHEVCFECPDCGKGFSKKQSYKDHLKRYCPVRHKEKLYRCPICQKSIRTKNNVQVHLKVHSSQRKILRCSRCPATFKSQAGLRSHEEVKHEKRRYKCEECGKLITDPSALRQHLLRHRNIKAHSCLFCNKTFVANWDLFRHLGSHTREGDWMVRTHSCTFCGKKFRNERLLYSHLYCHIGEKWHACSICGNQFTSKQAAVCHIRRFHKEV